MSYRLLVVLFGVMLLCCPAGRVGADGEAPIPPHLLDDGLIAVRALLDAGECEKGVTDLKALIAQEGIARKDFAKARRAEIADLMESLACGAKFTRPNAKDMISGSLEKWDRAKNKVRITYTPKSRMDLESSAKLMMVPGRVRGPLTLEIRGSYWSKNKDAPHIEFGGDKDPKTGKPQKWKITFGLPDGLGRKTKAPVKIEHFEGGESKRTTNKKVRISKPDKPYKLILKIASTKISVSLNGKSAGYAKKHKTTYGSLAFGVEGWTDIKISGVMDTQWIQSKFDEAFRKQLREFRKSYKPTDHLPIWLFQTLSRTESKPRGKEVDLIARLSGKHYDALLAIENHVRADESDEATEALNKAQADGMPEATCEFIRAKLRHRMQQLEKALVHLRRCNELEPNFLDGVLMQGSICQELGRFDEALTTFESATGGHGFSPRAFEEAAQSMLYAGRPEDAARMTRLAARNGAYSKKLITLTEALAKVVNGPDFIKRYEVKSNNYHVISNIDQALCDEGARLLEESFEAFREHIAWVEVDRTRLFKVYLFNTRKGFFDYQGNITEFMGKPTDKAAGLYSPLLKQLLIWKQPRIKDMFETVRHEGFHQYLDRLMNSPPTWFNEGMAVYHENPKKEGGKLTFGHMHPYYLRLLHKDGLKPLKKFLFIAPAVFYEEGSVCYAQAWLLVHMLQHTKPAYAKIFKTLMKDLQTQPAFEVVKRLFPDDLIKQMDSDLSAYLSKLDD